MMADYVIRNIGELWTQEHVPPVKGYLMNDVTVLHNAFVAVQGDCIAWVGTGPGIDFIGPKTVLHDALGAVVVPGLVDGHTHLVHAGSREQEFALKLAGVSYLDILRQGGG
ncbi:MAG: imidazolonepropionase, partial [bacterium]